ncbi:MAG: membrane protein insertion efficiency factor YidD [Actinobacteria bacterium]|nr:membrane protein insertion efficiency factor YidD [Actinomycetota bacterium]MCL6104280.1 membrane protein insertion efficiency factor YidD [Actinomycetota bacterium]
MIHLYQAFRNGHPSQCRYTPSCSVYALQAIELHGPLKGVLLATKRIIRCNPWGKWGYDPVPAKNVIQAQKSEAIS